MDAHVLVPVKAMDPKSRLGAALTLEERTRLMSELLEHVVGEIRSADVAVTVVCGEELAGYDTWVDGGLPWNDALATAAQEVVSTPLVAFVSADLPRVQGKEIVQLIEATPQEGIAIGRAYDGGTNAIAMRPPGLVMTHF